MESVRRGDALEELGGPVTARVVVIGGRGGLNVGTPPSTSGNTAVVAADLSRLPRLRFDEVSEALYSADITVVEVRSST